VLDAYQYVALKNEALVNAGTYNPASAFTLVDKDANGNDINTDWTKVVYRVPVVHTFQRKCIGR
jgi:hypothetical protein